MRPPEFWRSGGPLATALAPFSVITRIATARRVARPGWRAPVPVFCAGNATVGGAGKTPLALELLHRLRAAAIDAHAITRGHGGRLPGPVRVDPACHHAADVGDEALLLARVAPAWAGADRAASARAAVAAGAQALVMDDGLQNPLLAKTLSFLVIDGGAGFGNGRLLPAGPLREPVASAAARCAAAVIVGDDDAGATRALPPNLPVLRARLEPDQDMRACAGRRVAAFAGIGRPEKFFVSLQAAGALVVARTRFGDHHRFRPAEVARLRDEAASLNADLVTTWKDWVRLPQSDRAAITPLGVSLAWTDSAALQAMILGAFTERR